MEKILLALDAQHINTQTVDFACYLARLTNSRLTGIFLEDLLSEGAIRFEIAQEMALPERVVDARETPMGARNEITETNIKSFRQSCDCRGIHAHVHRDRGIPVDEVIEESRFADLLVVDVDTSFAQKRDGTPHKFVKDVLQEAECPVVLAPYSFHSIDEIIFAYNGSASSVFAIKQFTYLFPEWRQKKVTIVEVKEKDDNAIGHQRKMKEWLEAHYPNVELKVLAGDPSDQLFGYLIEKKNAMVVMGAYGRNMLSSFFKRSHAHLIVKTVNLPIFITHH
ncbi:MAG: universal stress protein [Chitinophagaceae bacterium]|nr:universal stress protein [Chitinophagaceae bacterium]